MGFYELCALLGIKLPEEGQDNLRLLTGSSGKGFMNLHEMSEGNNQCITRLESGSQHNLGLPKIIMTSPILDEDYLKLLVALFKHNFEVLLPVRQDKSTIIELTPIATIEDFYRLSPRLAFPHEKEVQESMARMGHSNEDYLIIDYLFLKKAFFPFNEHSLEKYFDYNFYANSPEILEAVGGAGDGIIVQIKRKCTPQNKADIERYFPKTKEMEFCSIGSDWDCSHLPDSIDTLTIYGFPTSETPQEHVRTLTVNLSQLADSDVLDLSPFPNLKHVFLKECSSIKTLKFHKNTELDYLDIGIDVIITKENLHFNHNGTISVEDQRVNYFNRNLAAYLKDKREATFTWKKWYAAQKNFSPEIRFPEIKKLLITDHDGAVEKTIIDLSCFPHLREMECKLSQELSFTSMASSVEKLTINGVFGENNMVDLSHISQCFPNLKELYIICKNTSSEIQGRLMKNYVDG